MAPKKLTLNDYLITEDGQVINKITNHILKPQPNAKGYLRVCIGGIKYFVHRLVAERYIPNPENKEQVNHIDGNKLNNSVTNLEWTSNKENRIHAVKNKLHLQGEDCPWSKLTQENITFIRNNLNLTNKELAKKFNVSVSTISDIKNYKTWKP